MYNLAAVFAVFILLIFQTNNKNMNSQKLISVEFEVFGRVQGVFFRKYTQQESKKLGLRGWCMNTNAGTVQGVLRVPSVKKNWLQTVGSPMSKIEKAQFTNEKEIANCSFSNFSIKR